MAEDRISNEQLKRLAFKEEQRFISILLKDKRCLMEAIAYGIKAGKEGHFWYAEHRFLFSIINQYYIKYGNMLSRTAMESIMDSIDNIDGIELTDEDKASARISWDKIYAVDTNIDDFNLLLKQINNRHIQWQAYRLIQKELSNLATSTNNQDTIVRKIQENLNKIDSIGADPYCLAMNFNDGMDKALEFITYKRDNPNDTNVVLTGITAIDDIYCGFDYGSYCIITGMINGGKTTMMFNFAFNMAKNGYNVVYISLEKKAVPFFTRLLSLYALVDYNRIRRGGKGSRGIDEETYKRLKEASEELKTKIQPKLTCIQLPTGTNLSKILAEVDKIKKDKKIDVLLVDYLGAINPETNTSGRPDLDEARTSQRLQAYGRVNNIVTITATQLKTPSSKDIRNKAKKASTEDASMVEVNTEDMAGSKMIIADADFAIGVVLNSDQPPTKMFAHTTKARDAESRRTVILDFDGRLGRISDPVLEPGQIKAVDELLYNKEITEEKLLSEDNLFAKAEKSEKVEKSEKIEKKEEIKPILKKQEKVNKPMDIDKDIEDEETKENNSIFDVD